MITLVKTLLLIVSITAFVFSELSVVFFTIYEIFGYPTVSRLLEWLHIPLSYDQILVVGFICIAIAIITYFVRIKLFRK